MAPTALCRLLAGFARGQLVEWDITTGKVYSHSLNRQQKRNDNSAIFFLKLLRDLADLHPPGSGILTTRYPNPSHS